MKIKYYCLFLLLASALTSCGQSFKGRTVIGKKLAENQVKEALAGKYAKSYYNTKERKTDIDTKEKAIKFAEAITFKIYGEEQIKSEKPYECYLINGFWYVSGTLPENYRGGCFEIIFNAKDSRIIRLTHYK